MDCENPCPDDCPSVFDRVVVSYVIAGGTRIMWELLPTFMDHGPLTFQLQVGETASNDADDWLDVGLPVVDQYYAVDAEQRVWGKTNFTHYRIKLTTPTGEYVSTPVGGMGILDHRDWLLARNLLYQRRIQQRLGPGGQRGYLLKRRWTGTPCQTCLDLQTEEVRNPDCPSCFGTGKECGYYYPQSCIWATLNHKGYRAKTDANRWTVNDIVCKAEFLCTEMLGEEDIWVAAKTDDRYYVHEVQHTAEIRGVPLVADVVLRLVPFSSPIYAIEIPQQLTEIGGA